MARRSEAHKQAERREKDAKALLISRMLPPQVATQPKRRNGGIEYWEVRTSNPIVVDLGLEGDWDITMYWRYRDVPGGDRSEAILVDSSISLNVQHRLVESHEFKSLVRYDLDRLGGVDRIARGPHIQTCQFKPLDDQVHYLAAGLPSDFEWDVEEVIDFLREALPEDLAAHGWPRA